MANQTFRDFEHIVVDPGSTDNTSALLLDSNKHHATSVLLGKDPGLSTSRNIGLRLARGKYYINLDADDQFEPQALEHMVALMDERTIVCPGMKEFGPGAQGAGWPSSGLTLDDLQRGNRIFCASMFPAEAFWAVGGYDPEFDYLGYEDWALWLALVKYGLTVKVLPELVFLHRGSALTGRSDSSTQKTLPRHEERMVILRHKYGVK